MTSKREKNWILLVDYGNGQSSALKVKPGLLLVLLSQIVLGFFLCLVGTLLFFREADKNRKLKIEVQNYEIQAWISKNKLPDAEKALEASRDISKEGIKKPTTTLASALKVSEMTYDCAEETCYTAVNLANTGQGIYEGSLLMVLEALVPRIGAPIQDSAPRKKFLIYPGEKSLDEFDPSKTADLQKKNFKFTRALSTNHAFKLGKLLKPAALHVFIYDAKDGLVLRESKTLLEE